MKIISIVVILTTFLCIPAFAQESRSRAADYIASGVKLLDSGKLQEANSAFQKAAELEPDNIKALEGLGKTYLYLDKNKEAERIFNRVLKLDPRNISAMTSLAMIYSWSKRYQEAVNLYKKVLEIDPKNIMANTGLAEAYNWMGSRKQSITQYEEVLRQDPRDIRAYKGLAEVYVWDNRLKDAEGIYKNALNILPQSAPLHNSLANIYVLMGSWSQAKEEYGKALAIEPQNKDAFMGARKASIQLMPANQLIFKYINEKDVNAWRANSFTWGYRRALFFDYGNSLYVADYVNNFSETGHGHKVGDNLEVGGRYNFRDFFTVMGSADISSYNHGPSALGTGTVSAIIKYYNKNSLALNYSRELFDLLDNIRDNRYGVESNFYLGRHLLITNAYNYADYSDDNRSKDLYNALTFIIFKGKLDLNFTFGYRERDFKTVSPQYYSPHGLDTIIYSVYVGKPFKQGYFYGMFKYNANSDHNDTRYYLLGGEYNFNDRTSLSLDVSYFANEEKYQAITTAVAFNFKF